MHSTPQNRITSSPDSDLQCSPPKRSTKPKAPQPPVPLQEDHRTEPLRRQSSWETIHSQYRSNHFDNSPTRRTQAWPYPAPYPEPPAPTPLRPTVETQATTATTYTTDQNSSSILHRKLHRLHRPSNLHIPDRQTTHQNQAHQQLRSPDAQSPLPNINLIKHHTPPTLRAQRQYRPKPYGYYNNKHPNYMKDYPPWTPRPNQPKTHRSLDTFQRKYYQETQPFTHNTNRLSFNGPSQYRTVRLQPPTKHPRRSIQTQTSKKPTTEPTDRIIIVNIPNQPPTVDHQYTHHLPRRILHQSSNLRRFITALTDLITCRHPPTSQMHNANPFNRRSWP